MSLYEIRCITADKYGFHVVSVPIINLVIGIIAILFWHDDIEEEKSHVIFIFFKFLYHIISIYRFDNPVAIAFEDFPNKVSYIFFIFSYKYRFSPADNLRNPD